MSDDRMNDRLTDAGTRWREGQPDRHVAVPVLRQRSTRLPVYAAAAVVLAVAGGGWALGRADHGSTPSSGPSAATSASPTPAGPRDCTAADLSTTQTTDAAMGTAYLEVTFSGPEAGCRLQGVPEVALLDHGRPLDVEVQAQAGDRGPVRVDARRSAALQLGWSPTHSCADVDNDIIRITLPDGTSLEVPGFGQTSCNPGEADLQPLQVQPFTPARP